LFSGGCCLAPEASLLYLRGFDAYSQGASDYFLVVASYLPGVAALPRGVDSYSRGAYLLGFAAFRWGVESYSRGYISWVSLLYHWGVESYSRGASVYFFMVAAYLPTRRCLTSGGFIPICRGPLIIFLCLLLISRESLLYLGVFIHNRGGFISWVSMIYRCGVKSYSRRASV